MRSRFVSPRGVHVANDILSWATNYLMTENASIKRPQGSQVVCPFVKPSVDNNSFYLSLHPEVNGQDARQIENIMVEEMMLFDGLGPFDKPSQMKKALLVVFHNIPEDHTRVLDVVHEELKDKFVENGLMLGQFHQNCDERAIHNAAFPVSVSPHPLIAMRKMAIHDILFLGSDSDWFSAYNLRFGHRFNEPDKIEDYDKHLIALYHAAKRKWGS